MIVGNSMAVFWLVLAIASGLLSFGLVALIKGQFSQWLLDIPNERSSHTQPTPRGGGLGFAIAFAMASLMAEIALRYFPQIIHPELLDPDVLASFQETALPLWCAIAPLAIVGFWDDRHGLPSGVRYLVQLAVAGIACLYCGAFPQPWLTEWGVVGQGMAWVLTAIGFTALINFYNFMDGLDGLVAGVTSIQLGFLAIYLDQPILWLLVAALLGFLRLNWSPAQIFMGDAGSTVLGAAVAIALLSASVTPIHAWSALAIALPLTGDAMYTLVLRLSRGENIFQAHRQHLCQRLQQAGWSHDRVAIVYMALTLAMALGIYSLGTVGAGLSLLASCGAIALAEWYLRFSPGEAAPTHPSPSPEPASDSETLI